MLSAAEENAAPAVIRPIGLSATDDTLKSLPVRLLTLAIAAAFAIVLMSAACGPSAETPANTGGSAATSYSSTTSTDSGTTQTDKAADPGMYASLSGDIAIDGSSTVFPITEAVAEEFGDLADGNVRVVVGISGTGGGFKKFCANETVISDASRPIKQKEVDLCAAAGIEYVELPVAIDGLSVVVNPANDFIDCLSVDQLNMIWKPESEGVITMWNQVDPSWPAEEIKMYAPRRGLRNVRLLHRGHQRRRRRVPRRLRSVRG